MQITPKSGRGRPLSEKQTQARTGIVEAFKTKEAWSTGELAEYSGVDSDEILRAMRFFQREGYVIRDGNKKVVGRPGHPAIKWRRVLSEEQ